MYSPQVLDHLETPRNVGDLTDATATGRATNPVCGDELYLQLKLDGDRITDARFRVQGCPPSIAAGSALTELIVGRSVAEAAALTPSDITHALGSLPRNKQHCAVLAIDALHDALRDAQKVAVTLTGNL